MTREEAMEILKREVICVSHPNCDGCTYKEKDCLGKMPTDDVYGVVFNMAIKALEQESCEDCISRQAVKRKLQEHHDLFINAYGGRVGFKSMADAKEKARVDEITNCISMVVNEPSVTPKEKTGHWIDDGFYAEGHSEIVYRCSQCNHCIIELSIEEYNFCPNCGARMVSE